MIGDEETRKEVRGREERGPEEEPCAIRPPEWVEVSCEFVLGYEEEEEEEGDDRPVVHIAGKPKIVTLE